MIKSILDTDLYKLTMQKLVLNQYPSANAKYRFKCRNKGIDIGFLAYKVRQSIKEMSDLALSQDEESFLLESVPFLSTDYIKYLKDYRFNPDQVKIANVDNNLEIEIDGPWVETILWEVPILSIVNETYFQETTDFKSLEDNGISRLGDKIKLINQYSTIKIAEFGTRRRYSGVWQQRVLQELRINCTQLIGTSNVKLAMDTGLKPVGTMAHEYISAHLALVDNIRTAQSRSFYVWLQEYKQDLGIALTDTFTSKAFLKDFDIVLSESFRGVRHDSGDPISFGESIIGHYKRLGIDPLTKTIIFSDGLDVPAAIRIFKHFVGRIGVSFGIGTNLTNDLGATPLNIVIKLVEINGLPVVKISDNPGKAIGDANMISKVREQYCVNC